MQGVGFGMVLLQGLTRLHVTFALGAARVVCLLWAILAARATVSNRIGPGTVPPDSWLGWSDGWCKLWFLGGVTL